MAVQSRKTVSVDDAVEKLRRLGEAAVGTDAAGAVHGVVLLDEGGIAARRALADLRRWARDTGASAIVEGQCEPDVKAPYAPFGEIAHAVVDWLGPSEPALLRRYAAPVVGVAPLLAGAEPFRDVVLPQAGMAAYCFRGHAHELHEFFQGRNVSPWMIDEIVRFLLDAADSERGAAHPLIVICHEMQDASPQALRVFRLLARYGRKRPLVVCGVFRATPSLPILSSLVASGDFELVTLSSDPFDPEPIEAARRCLPIEGQQLLAACARLRRPADPGETATVAGIEDRERAQSWAKELAAAEMVDIWANGRIVVPRDVRAVVELAIRADARRRFSQAALALATTNGDLYQRAYHASEAGTPDVTELIRPAIERAWDISAYATALYYAERFIAAGARGLRIEPGLLLFFLNSEAGNGAAADAQVAAALGEATDPRQTAFLTHLRGYNATFVLRDMNTGLRYFQAVLDHAQQHGPLPNLPWIKNSMAFALNQLGKGDEALELEQDTLAGSGARARQDRFLSTILHLNLGRLHRPRSLETASRLIQTSIDDSAGELTLHHLLLSYMTFENLHRWKGSPSEALAFLRLSVSLFNDDGVALSKRVFPLISRTFVERIGALDDDRVLKSDQVRLCVALNFALAHDELGNEPQAAIYREWLHRRLMDLGEPELAALVGADRALSGIVDEASRPGPSASVDAALDQLQRHAHLVQWKAEGGATTATIGDALADGRVVGWLRTDRLAHATAPFDSVVLMDSRARRSPAQMLRDLRQEDAVGAILATPQGAEWFTGVDPHWPLVPQEGTLRKRFSDLVPGVSPVRARVYVLPREGQSELAAILSCVQGRTGIPLVVMLPFRVIGEEIATTVDAAVKCFLETAIDLLVCDGALVEKRHGATAPENLALLRPALCGVLIDPPKLRADARGVFASRDRRVSVGARGWRLLEQCDGERTVAQLAAGDGGAEDVYGFFRRARSEGMVRFTL